MRLDTAIDVNDVTRHGPGLIGADASPAGLNFRLRRRSLRPSIDLWLGIRIFRGSFEHPPARPAPRGPTRAKPASIKIRLNSSADTGYFYVTKKNARTKTEKLVMKKYDPVVRKHVEFKEGKIK